MKCWKVLGIEESDGERCECCGTRCQKRRIVLSDGVNDYRYGTNCAALKVYGSKAHISVDKVLRKGKAERYVSRQIAKFGKGEEVLRRIADTVTSHYLPCWVDSGEIRMA